MSDLKIMVVEDESLAVLDIKRRLKKLGYVLTRSVFSGEEAVSAAAQDKPDLILMDIVLAGEMDGIQAAGEIRASHDIPIIFLTAYADAETLHKAKFTGPSGYIIKPFEDREIQTAIELALYKHEAWKKEKAHQQWLSTTLESIGDGVVTTDAEGRVTYMNGVAEVLTGWKAGNAMGRDLSEVFHVLEEEGGGLFSNLAVEIVQKKHIIATDDAVLLLGNDREVPLELFATPILDEKRILTGMVLAFRDISGRKRAEETLKQNVQNLRRTLDETVNALAVASEKRDPYTAGHQQRVSKLACAIAEEMGLSEDQVDGIRVASLLHDIGKIHVPAEILAKPAKLTEMEFGIMKTHPEVGHEILKKISFPWPVAEIVLQHHERLDGSGYPSGLSGEKILLEAKILAVADVVEAMSSHRPYRASLGLEPALDEISKNRKIRYDSDVVGACQVLFHKENFTFD